MKKENLLYRITSIIRIAVLLFTIFFVFNGFGVYAREKASSLFMYANLTNFGFWVFFMMGSILISPLGRFFCGICPVGEVNHIFSKMGTKKSLNLNWAFLQGFSLIMVFILVIVFHFSRHPHLTSILIIAVFILSAFMGLIFNGNSFCLSLCPANAYLRFYGRLSLFRLFCNKEAKSSNCMVFLNPCNVKKEQCHLCFRCFKDANGMYLKKDSKPFDSIAHPFNSSEMFIFSVLSGLTIMAFIRVVRQIRELFVFPPYLIAQHFGLSEEYIMLLLVIFGVFIYPALFYSIFASVMKFVKRESFISAAKTSLPYFIPSVFAVHLILAITKVNTRIGFLPFTLKDPSGKDMVQLYASGKIDIPADFINIVYFKYLILAIPLIAFFLAFYLVKKKPFVEKTMLLLSQTLFLIFVEYCIFSWLFKGFLL